MTSQGMYLPTIRLVRIDLIFYFKLLNVNKGILLILILLIVLVNLFLFSRNTQRSGVEYSAYSISASPQSPTQTPEEEDSKPKINRVSQQHTSQSVCVSFTVTRFLFTISDFFKSEAIQLVSKFLLKPPQLFFSERVSRILLAPNAP